eukprot:1217408-Rhodomonas_salina.1
MRRHFGGADRVGSESDALHLGVGGVVEIERALPVRVRDLRRLLHVLLHSTLASAPSRGRSCRSDGTANAERTSSPAPKPRALPSEESICRPDSAIWELQTRRQSRTSHVKCVGRKNA